MAGEDLATVGTSTASGAAAGSVFGPYGTAIGAGVGFVGGLVQVFGARQEGKAISEAYARKARIAQENAQSALLQTFEDERRLRVSNRKALSKQYSDYISMAGSGSASALDMLAESARNMELDALTVRYRGLVTAQNFINEASTSHTSASQAITVGNINAASAAVQTFMGTAEKIGSMKRTNG